MNPRDELIALTTELERRARRAVGFPIDDVYGEIPEQLRSARSDAKFQVNCCSRKAGKTTVVSGKLLKCVRTAPNHPPAFYVGPTLKNARHILWPVLKAMNTRHRLGGVPNESEAYMKFPDLPGEPKIHLFGAKDAGEIEPIRSYQAGLAIIDEVQSARPMVLQTLIDDIIEPALLPYDGRLVIAGTPGPICAGYFWDIVKGKAAHAWEHFGWTMRDNVHLQRLSGRTVDELLREVRERHNWTEDNPTYRREYMGEWVEDEGALMLHYDAARNGCAWQEGPVKGWTYVLGGDLGYEDADALTVQGWAPNSRKVQKCAEFVRPKQGISELGRAVRSLFDVWHPIAMPFDFGGLGKKIAIELQQRWTLPVEAAEKERKAEHVLLLDDALISGNFLAPPDSRLAQDAAIMQWDQEAKAKGNLREDPAHHSDIMDADLYAFRKCWAYLEKDPPPQPKDDAERAEFEARRLRSERVQQVAKQRDQDEAWWEGLE